MILRFSGGSFYVSGPSAMSGGTDGTGADNHAPSSARRIQLFNTYDQLDDLSKFLKACKLAATSTTAWDSSQPTLPESGATAIRTRILVSFISDGCEKRGYYYSYDGLTVLYRELHTTAQPRTTPTVTFIMTKAAPQPRHGPFDSLYRRCRFRTYTYNSLGQTLSLSRLFPA